MGSVKEADIVGRQAAKHLDEAIRGVGETRRLVDSLVSSLHKVSSSPTVLKALVGVEHHMAADFESPVSGPMHMNFPGTGNDELIIEVSSELGRVRLSTLHNGKKEDLKTIGEELAQRGLSPDDVRDSINAQAKLRARHIREFAMWLEKGGENGR